MDNYFEYEEELRVGTIIQIKGKKLIARVFNGKNGPYIFYYGEIIRNVTVGGYVVIPVGYSLVIARIYGEIAEERKNNDSLYNDIDILDRKIELEIIGNYSDGKFVLGINMMPLINSDVFVAKKELVDSLLDFSKREKEDNFLEKMYLGKDVLNRNKVYASIDRLFANHIGIFGNTGSGKSYTLAYLYENLFKYNFTRDSKFIFFDFTGEYNNCFCNKKRTYILSLESSDKVYVSQKTIFDFDLLVALSNATEKTQEPVIKDTIDYYNDFVGKKLEPISFLEKINRELDYDKKLFKSLCYPFILENENYQSNIETKKFMINENRKDNRFDLFKVSLFITSYIEYKNSSNKIDSYLKKMLYRLSKIINNLSKVFKINYDNNDKDDSKTDNIIIINLNNINVEYQKIISSIIIKYYYDLCKSKDMKINYTTNIIIDEAHVLMSEVNERENDVFGLYRIETFEEYIKEGRKYGCYFTVATQRPSEISQTIISQMHNYFIHRLMNNKDLNTIRNGVSFLDEASMILVPSLPTGQCIFSGVATNFPIQISIPTIDSKIKPISDNASIVRNMRKDNE